MTQHALSSRSETEGLWLPLTEYSVRSGISLSTIRRKIKNNSIPFRLERGRYLILYRGEKANAWGISSSDDSPKEGNNAGVPQSMTTPIKNSYPPERTFSNTTPSSPTPDSTTLSPASPMANSRYVAQAERTGAPFSTQVSAQVQPGTSFEDALHMMGDAFEHAIREKDERIRLLEQQTVALEERVIELKTLVKVLEEKYAVRY